MSELAAAIDVQATEEAGNAAAPDATPPASSTQIDISNEAADNDGINAEARKLQALLAQELIDLSKADSEEAFAIAEEVLAAHKMRFQRKQQGRIAALDALRQLGLTIHDVGWTEVTNEASVLALAGAAAGSNNEESGPQKRVRAKPAQGTGNKKSALQAL